MPLNHAVGLLCCAPVLLSAFVVRGEYVRTRLQEGDVWVGEGGLGVGKKFELPVQTCLSVVFRAQKRAGRDSDDLVHWISNQAEHLCHLGS